MIEEMIQAISIALDAEFGEAYKIYPELTEQELLKPCFFVYCLKSSCNVYRGKRYFSRNTFIVQYFPSTSNIEMECNRIAERLFHCLEYVYCVNDTEPIMGTGMESKLEDERLFFKVNYNLFLLEKEESVPMEILEQKVGREARACKEE